MSEKCFCSLLSSDVNFLLLLNFTFILSGSVKCVCDSFMFQLQHPESEDLQNCLSLSKTFTNHQLFASCCVRIKAFPAFHSKLSCRYHIYQQRTRCIFGITKAI